MEVIDIGCGSGILSIAAHLLGAHHVLAVDIDPLSVKATRDNAILNGIQEGIDTGFGSVNEIVQNKFSIQTAEIVLANILAPVIITLMGEGLADLVKPEGILILSGILDHQKTDVTNVVTSHGFIKSSLEQFEDWVSLAFLKRSS
jgi:ribosomal protein L11 methyltransferase